MARTAPIAPPTNQPTNQQTKQTTLIRKLPSRWFGADCGRLTEQRTMGGGWFGGARLFGEGISQDSDVDMCCGGELVAENTQKPPTKKTRKAFNSLVGFVVCGSPSRFCRGSWGRGWVLEQTWRNLEETTTPRRSSWPAAPFQTELITHQQNQPTNQIKLQMSKLPWR